VKRCSLSKAQSDPGTLHSVGFELTLIVGAAQSPLPGLESVPPWWVWSHETQRFFFHVGRFTCSDSLDKCVYPVLQVAKLKVAPDDEARRIFEWRVEYVDVSSDLRARRSLQDVVLGAARRESTGYMEGLGASRREQSPRRESTGYMEGLGAPRREQSHRPRDWLAGAELAGAVMLMGKDEQAEDEADGTADRSKSENGSGGTVDRSKSENGGGGERCGETITAM